ncbi:type I restriction-modification system subunit M [Synechococcus sp. BA-132 BA5]|uniref:type I restriction-modification system subunit M n=1 Tax=Synechococcus sp. BA-132 BA5 TaxID=3110252 RepID=UPI002B208AD3|nr:N-6 DNA methylase [Synechococcus sp. BA-132 BA5]MEA5414287.1 N-6 DNA methylase [Synechococcus sp. BA-132 BA5]
MPVRTDLTDALLALIPEDGSRLSNAELRAELLDLADEPFRDEEFEAAKDHVVAMGAAEKARGPGGGLKAPGVSPPPRAATPSGNGRSRRSGTGAAPASTQPSIAPGTTAASVLTGELRNQIDAIWNAFWSGGIANPLEVLEQLTYLLFIRRLDELETLEERRAQRTEKPMQRRIFPEGADGQGRPWQELRWSRFKELAEPAALYQVVSERVFPFLKQLGGDESAYASHMRDARFTIPTPALLAKVVDLLAAVPMEQRDTKGDIYEYMLGKLATAGTNGQFRTPRHIIELMVAMTEPTPPDVMVDPACGTCGFPVAVGEYLREHHPEVLSDPELREHFNHGLFHGFDFDNTMLRIGAMNMLLHGVENPDVSYRDSLSEDSAIEENKYTLLLANPPFAGSLDYESTSGKLQRVVKTKKTELLFMALFLQLLKPGGRAAVIVPDGVLFGSSKAHKELRRTLVEDHYLEGVMSLPSGVFRPYAGVSTAILFFTKTGRGGTDQVWFYDMTADGWSLDGKRNPLLPLEKLGPAPKETLAEGEHEKNNLPDCLTRWRQRKDSERERERTAQSFCVPKAEIAEQGYDLSLNRYKELVHEEVEHRPPLEILAELRVIEQEILQGIEELEGMLR